MKKSVFNKMLDLIFKEVTKRIEDRTDMLQKRIDALETRDRERSFGRFLGSYQRALLPQFKRGDAVVYDNGLWLALSDAPGEIPGDGWQLVVRPSRRA